MSESKLQFRVGLFVIFAAVVTGTMIFKFSDMESLWRPTYELAIHFDSAPGVHVSTPVRRNGISIGEVSGIVFDDRHGGVTVVVRIDETVHLRADTQPQLIRSLLGDASIEFTPGHASKPLAAGARLEGASAVDPMQIVSHLDQEMSRTLTAFRQTSDEWRRVGGNLNSLLDTNRGNLNQVVERAAESLHQFTLTMQDANRMVAAANKIVADPQNQANLRKTLAALPKMAEETRQTIAAVKLAVQSADRNLKNLNDVTGPLAKRSQSIVVKLDGTLGNLESFSKQLDDFARLAAGKNGSLRQFTSDPELYRNLNRSAASLAVLLKNIEPVIHDLRVFSDKVARHPELIGVSGALKGSSGLKDPPPQQPIRQTRRPGFRRN